MEPIGPPQQQSRVQFIDGLRGVAALMVAVGHTFSLSKSPSKALDYVRVVTDHGYLGVPIFFVISGFVIANSLRDVKITPKFCGLYALRRSVRLDPPCWFAILLSICYGYTFGFPSDPGNGVPPTPSLLLAHLFYLQGLLHLPNLNPVLWTLCLEVQFYTTYLVLRGLAQKLSISVYWPVLLLGCASLPFSVSGGYSDMSRFVLIDPHRCLFPIFSMFAIGIVIWLHHAKLVPFWSLALWIGLVTARTWYWKQRYLIGALAAGLIIFVGLRWKIMAIENRFVLFLGRISYSLYLIHYNVSEAFLIVARRLTGSEVETSLAWCAAAVGISVLAAWGMNVLIEQPALKLSKRIAPRRQREKEPPIPVAVGDPISTA